MLVFKRFFFIGSLFFLVSQLSADHFPLGCYFIDGESAYPVVSVDGESPVIVVDGKRKEVEMSGIIFSKMPIYAGGYVKILDHRVLVDRTKGTRSFTMGYGDHVPSPTFIDVKFKPEMDYNDLYALVVSGSPKAMQLEDPDGLFMTFTRIGKVKAGKESKEALKAYVSGEPSAALEMDYTIVFYDQGTPVMSDFSESAYEHFRLRRLQSHDEKVEGYLASNKGETLKQKAYSTFTPYLPKALYNELGSVDTKVIFTVTAEGYVEPESFSNLENPEAEAFLRKALTDWFFYPKLEEGKPVAVRTATMIKF